MNKSGFTLVEILISILMFSIILTTVFMSFDTVFLNSEYIMNNVNTYEMANTCLNRMIEDLQSLYIAMPPEYAPPDFDDPPDPYRLVGDAVRIHTRDFSRLRFASLSHIPFDNPVQKGIAEIIYYVQEAKDGSFVLRRSDHLYPYPPFRESEKDPVLCERITSLKFLFYDTGGSPQQKWDSDSDEFNYDVPRAIGIHIEIDGNALPPARFETAVSVPFYRPKPD